MVQTLLYGVGPWDPAAHLGAALLLALMAAAAAFGPARRATHIDPAVALRHD